MPAPRSAIAALLTAGEVDVQTLPDLPRRDDGTIDLDRLHAGVGGTLLESAPDTPATGRHSYVVADHAARLTCHATQSRLQMVAGPTLDLGRDPFAAMAAVFAAAGLTPDGDRSGLPPLCGGAVGAWSYDLGRAVEQIPVTNPPGDPTRLWADLLLVDAVVAVDHDSESATLIRRPLGARTPRDADDVTAMAKAATVGPTPTPVTQRASTTLPRDAYLRAVEQVLAHIAAGDAFQVNLTQQLAADWAGTIHELYRALRAHSPAPYGACHTTADGDGIASISPETFLHAAGRQVTTRPIKGTRPRSDDLLTDLALKRALASSAKDRAENVMVVDMERNDLGRVCVPGSIRVPDLLTVEGHPTVWQLVSTVTGTLADGAGYAELLRATFPCGSITGTPKVRAMQIIEDLEPVRRSWYCGALGFVSVGAMSTSVAIRTAVLRDGLAVYGAGGGIVADSVPADEYVESLDKAVPFLTAVTGDPRGGL